MTSVPVGIRVASLLYWITAVGFALPCIPAIRNLLKGRDIPFIMGFPAYGRGPFERVGVRTTVPLLAGFLLFCILQGVAGWLLWDGQQTGAFLALGLLPVGALFWWGFALPIPPIFAAVSVVLIFLNWGELR